jgi:hypothetical protein
MTKHEEEIIGLAITIASSVQAQSQCAEKNKATHRTTVTNWEYLEEISQRIFDANARLQEEST